MKTLIIFHDFDELQRYGYVYHHTAMSRERCNKPFIREYSGRYGVGYIYAYPYSARYCKIEYYVEPLNW